MMDNIKGVHMNLHELNCSYEAKITQRTLNLFELQFLMHPKDLLCKMSVVEYSY